MLIFLRPRHFVCVLARGPTQRVPWPACSCNSRVLRGNPLAAAGEACAHVCALARLQGALADG